MSVTRAMAGTSDTPKQTLTTLSQDVSHALSSVQKLQQNVHKLLGDLTTWKIEESEVAMNKTKQAVKEIQELQSQLEKTTSDVSKLPDIQPVALGNTGLVTLDPLEEKASLYKNLLHSYTWITKLQSETDSALRGLKRKYPEPEHTTDERKRKVREDKRFINKVWNILQPHYPNVAFEKLNIEGDSCFKMVIKNVFVATLVFSGWVLDRIRIRGTQENEEDELDIWTPSKYIVFRKVTDVAQSTILRLYLSNDPEKMLKNFSVWLASYESLFSAKCEQCGHHLRADANKGELLPPCWRDINYKTAYHLGCK